MEEATLVELESFDRRHKFVLAGDGEGDRGVWLATDFEGWYDEPVTSIWNSHAFQIGATFGGIRIHQRDVIFGVEIEDTPEKSWRQNDSFWRKAWSYHKPSRLYMQTSESRRWLDIQMAQNPLLKNEGDPNKTGINRIVMTCVAGNPRWREPDVVKEFKSTTGNEAGEIWFPGNPTDTTIWVQWVATALNNEIWGIPDFSFGDDQYEAAELHAERMLYLPELIPGEHVWVNADPHEDLIRSSLDTEVWQRMDGQSLLYGIPPYTDPGWWPVEVTGGVPGSKIQLRVPRTWSRPWGLE